MRANSPSAYFASLSLHATVVAAVFLLALLLNRPAPEPPVIFELVAGEPLDGAERGPSAPADLQLNVPKVKLPPQPVRETPVETPPTPKEQPRPVEKKTPPPKETVKKAPPKAEPKTAPKPEPKMSYEEFVRQHGAPKTPTNTPPRPVNTPRIDTSKVVAGTRASGERGTATTATDISNQRAYEARLIALLKAAHEETKPTGLGDSVSAEVVFFLTADGQIRDVNIVRSSGHPEFDQSVLAAFRRITWPGPRPDKKNDPLRVTFRMREQ